MLVQKDLIQEKIKRLSLPERGELIWDINKEHYETKPVGAETFYSDRYFLGNSFKNSNNHLTIFPYWQDLLKKIYPSPFLKRYKEIILEAPIGSGKSYASVISLLYELYRLNCLRNPIDFHNLGEGTFIIFIFFSLNLESANINWNYAKSWISSSPYFNEFIKIGNAKRLPDNSVMISQEKSLYINVGSQTQHGISRAIHSFVLDESNFFKIKGMEKENYDALTTRLVSRFPTKDGISWVVSSALSDGSFIDEVKESSKNLKRTWALSCPPQWIIKGRDNFPKEEFLVFAGDIERDAFIVGENEENQVTPDMNLLPVPINFKDEFTKRLIKSLRDLGNFKNSSTARFFRNKSKLKATYTMPNRIINPVTKKPIEIIFLDEKDKSDTLIKYFETHLEYFKNPMMAHCKRFVHMDLGRTKDKFGIACSFASYTNDEYYRTPEAISHNAERFYYTDWYLTIKAKPNQQIPYYKIHDLFVWLRDYAGYDIEIITTDQREGGAKLRQDLNISGFNVDYLSVDRDRKPYEVAYDIVEEEKIIAPKSELIYLETSHLLDDGIKIDHPFKFENNQEGSKDKADAWVGSLYLAHKAEKIFNMEKLIKQEAQNKSSMTSIAHKNRIDNFSNNYFKNFYN